MRWKSVLDREPGFGPVIEERFFFIPFASNSKAREAEIISDRIFGADHPERIRYFLRRFPVGLCAAGHAHRLSQPVHMSVDRNY